MTLAVFYSVEWLSLAYKIMHSFTIYEFYANISISCCGVSVLFLYAFFINWITKNDQSGDSYVVGRKKHFDSLCGLVISCVVFFFAWANFFPFSIGSHIFGIFTREALIRIKFRECLILCRIYFLVELIFWDRKKAAANYSGLNRHGWTQYRRWRIGTVGNKAESYGNTVSIWHLIDQLSIGAQRMYLWTMFFTSSSSPLFYHKNTRINWIVSQNDKLTSKEIITISAKSTNTTNNQTKPNQTKCSHCFETRIQFYENVYR